MSPMAPYHYSCVLPEEPNAAATAPFLAFPREGMERMDPNLRYLGDLLFFRRLLRVFDTSGCLSCSGMASGRETPCLRAHMPRKFQNTWLHAQLLEHACFGFLSMPSRVSLVVARSVHARAPARTDMPPSQPPCHAASLCLRPLRHCALVDGAVKRPASTSSAAGARRRALVAAAIGLVSRVPGADAQWTSSSSCPVSDATLVCSADTTVAPVEVGARSQPPFSRAPPHVSRLPASIGRWRWGHCFAAARGAEPWRPGESRERSRASDDAPGERGLRVGHPRPRCPWNDKCVPPLSLRGVLDTCCARA